MKLVEAREQGGIPVGISLDTGKPFEPSVSCLPVCAETNDVIAGHLGQCRREEKQHRVRLRAGLQSAARGRGHAGRNDQSQDSAGRVNRTDDIQSNNRSSPFQASLLCYYFVDSAL